MSRQPRFRVLRALAASCCVLAAGCAGYKLGPASRPEYRSVAVPMFQNKTIHPQIEAQVTNAILRRFQNDGTLRIESESDADVVVTGQIVAYRRAVLRSARTNTGIAREYRVTVTARIQARNRAGEIVLKSTQVSGNADTFIGSDLQSADLQVLPLVADDLARQVVSLIAERW